MQVNYKLKELLEHLTNRDGWEKRTDVPLPHVGAEWAFSDGEDFAYVFVDQHEMTVEVIDEEKGEVIRSWEFTVKPGETSEEIREFVQFGQQRYYCLADSHVSAATPEEAARKFIRRLEKNFESGQAPLVDVFDRDLTDGMASDHRKGLFDPDSNYEDLS